MIHPYPGDSISISKEITISISDNCCVGSVNADAPIIHGNHMTDAFRFYQQQRKTILPQISPSTSAPSVVMVRKERTAE